MKIGIDIDGVLTDLEQFQYNECAKYVKLNYNKNIVNPYGYDSKDIFDITKEEDDNMWKYFYKLYNLDYKARKYASEVIKKMKEEGAIIYIITSRDNTTREDKEGFLARKNVVKWLSKNKIPYDKIIYTNDYSSQNKLNACINNNIDIMIEDKKENIESISEKIKVICFNANYNLDCKGKNIIRCYSWYDIYFKI